MMKLEEAENKFIEIWGSLGSQWGISRTMAQIHAYLMVKNIPKSTEEIMDDLMISRGNANMNTRTLIDWGLVHKVLKSGQRKEFFIAERDIWEVTKKIAAQRRKRELSPLLDKLEKLSNSVRKSKEVDQEHFLDLIKEIRDIAETTDHIIERIDTVEKSWLTRNALKLFKR